MLIYSICFSLSDLLHSVWQILGSSMSLQVTRFHSLRSDILNKYPDDTDALGLRTYFENHWISRCTQTAWLEDACCPWIVALCPLAVAFFLLWIHLCWQMAEADHCKPLGLLLMWKLDFLRWALRKVIHIMWSFWPYVSAASNKK